MPAPAANHSGVDHAFIKKEIGIKMQSGLKARRVRNWTHDYSHRVIYRMEADGALNARMEKIIRAKTRSMAWRFALVK